MGHVLTIRFERFTVFKPPALPEVMTAQLRIEAAREIRCARKVVFVGYSFPDADVHLKALFRKNIPPDANAIVINRTISDKIRAAYLAISSNVVFREVAFEEALADDQCLTEMFGPKKV